MINFKIYSVKRILVIWVAVFIFMAVEVKSQKTNFSGSNHPEYLYAFSEATRHFLFGNFVQAVTLYKECIRINPESGAAHFQLSKVYLGAGNIPLAREHAKKSVLFSDDNKWYLQQLADIFQTEQKFDSASMVLEHLLNMEGDNVNILYNMASLYEKQSKFDEALKYLDLIDNKIGLSKEVAMARYRIFETVNRPELALNQLKTANDLSYEDYSVSGMIAEFYRRHNQPDSAMKYYNIIYPAFKSETIVVFSYADFLLERGKTDSAQIIIAGCNE